MRARVGNSTGPCNEYLPIEAYAVIGNCHTAALISRDRSVDWYCSERCDAPAIFCRILDSKKGGFFRIAPTGDSSARRQYLKETNILETNFDCGGGGPFRSQELEIAGAVKE